MGTVNQISINISAELGSKKLPVHQLLRMGRGGVIELDNTENDDLTLLANGNPIAKGQVMLRGDKIMVVVTKLLPRPAERRAGDGLLESFQSQEVADERDSANEAGLDAQVSSHGEAMVDDQGLGAEIETPMPFLEDKDPVT